LLVIIYLPVHYVFCSCYHIKSWCIHDKYNLNNSRSFQFWPLEIIKSFASCVIRHGNIVMYLQSSFLHLKANFSIWILFVYWLLTFWIDYRSLWSSLSWFFLQFGYWSCINILFMLTIDLWLDKLLWFHSWGFPLKSQCNEFNNLPMLVQFNLWLASCCNVLAIFSRSKPALDPLKSSSTPQNSIISSELVSISGRLSYFWISTRDTILRKCSLSSNYRYSLQFQINNNLHPLLWILLSGDVAINPGPGSKYFRCLSYNAQSIRSTTKLPDGTYNDAHSHHPSLCSDLPSGL
jgi:hypothetical protein